MQPCLTGGLRRRRRSTPPASATAATAPPLRHRLRRQRRLHARPDDPRSTTTRRPIRAAWRWPAARAGAGSTTSTSPGPTPTRAPASPIGGAYWRITGPAGYDTGVKFAAGARHRRAPRPLRAGPRRLLASTSGCATKPATTRRPRRSRCRCASTTCRPGSPSRRARAPTSPSRSAPTSPTRTPGPAAGTISYRRLGAESWTELPTQAAAGRRGRQGDARRPHSGPGARHLRLPRRRRRRRRQRGLDHAARRRHRDGDAQGAARRSEQAGESASRTPRARRGSSPACAAATAAATR